jgi:stage IV sporulation protein FB
VLGFNLLPAFPLDGGRVLRALLASRLGLLRATRIAAATGQVLAVAGGAFGFMAGSPLLLLVAFFIFLAAGSEASAVATRVAGRGLRVAQMMVTDFRTIPVHATLAQAVELLLASEQREFPVVDNLGRTEGILTREDLIRGLSRGGSQTTVADSMTAGAPTVPPTLGFQEAERWSACSPWTTSPTCCWCAAPAPDQRGRRLFPRATSGSTPRGSTVTPRTRFPSRTR